MSTFSSYNTKIEELLANNSEVFYDTQMKRNKANDVTQEIAQQYDLSELEIRTHITFDANGIATRPADYFRMVKLWSSDKSGSITAFADAGGGLVTVTSATHGLANGNIITMVGTTSYNGIFTIANVATNTFTITDTFVADDATGTWTQGNELNEYIYRVPDVFDNLSTTAANYWTEDYVPGINGLRLKARPVTAGVLDIRYIRIPTVMNDDSTDNLLSSQWDEVIAYGTSARLLQISNRYDEAQEYERLYKKRLTDVYGATKNRGGIKQNNRFKSRYERVSQLGVNSVSSINL